MTTPGPVLARLSEPRADSGVRLAFVADAHLATDESGTWKQYHRTDDRLKRAISDVADREVDAVVFGGDQTKDGTGDEFRRFEELAAELEAPWVAIPGNHDVPKVSDDHATMSVAQFREAYTPGTFPFVFTVGDIDVVGLNSASTPDGRFAESWGGTVSREQVDWLRQRLPELATPVVVLHHNLVPRPEHVEDSIWDQYSVADPDPLLEVLAAEDVPLVLSAHHHLPATSAPHGVREIVAPAVCSFPPGYLLVDVSELGTVVRLVPLASGHETTAAYWSARTGPPLARGLAGMAARRLDSLPLVDQREDGRE